MSFLARGNQLGFDKIISDKYELRLFRCLSYPFSCEVVLVNKKDTVNWVRFRDMVHKVPPSQVDSQLAIRRGLFEHSEKLRHMM